MFNPQAPKTPKKKKEPKKELPFQRKIYLSNKDKAYEHYIEQIAELNRLKADLSTRYRLLNSKDLRKKIKEIKGKEAQVD